MAELLHIPEQFGRAWCESQSVNSAFTVHVRRYSLHKQVYSHRAGKAIEYMVRDALIEADSVWNGRLGKYVSCFCVEVPLRSVEDAVVAPQGMYGLSFTTMLHCAV